MKLLLLRAYGSLEHSYTYGKILDILIQCKTSNPIIYFDELDKVGVLKMKSLEF